MTTLGARAARNTTAPVIGAIEFALKVWVPWVCPPFLGVIFVRKPVSESREWSQSRGAVVSMEWVHDYQ